MNSKIVIVALNNNQRDPSRETFMDFYALSADQKINIIKQRIINICTELKRSEPDALWLIVWREYGVCGQETIYLTNKERRYLKDEMTALTEQYPQLGILAGTVSSRKYYTRVNEKLQMLNQAYQQPEYEQIKKIEAIGTKIEEDGQFLNHESQFRKVEQTTKTDTKGIFVVRNTAYFFNQGILYWRHDKITPFEEIEPKSQDIYQPATKKNRSCLLHMKHPVTGQELVFGIEICREHSFGLLQKEVLVSKLSKPLVHFVVGHGTRLQLEHICGTYSLLLDVLKKPRLVQVNQQNITKDEIVLYQHNILVEAQELYGPLIPLYPFALHVFDKIDEVLFQFPENHQTRKMLLLLRKNLQDFSEDISSDLFYECITVNLRSEEFLKKLYSEEEINSKFINRILSLWNKPVPNMKVWVSEMLAMLSKEKCAHPFMYDYDAQSDAPKEENHSSRFASSSS